MANGLINLQTDLKSLRYGSDKPYITKDIGNAPSGNGLSMQIERRVDDLSRITQMMIDKPGLKFLENQALLRQTDLLKKLSKAQNKGQFALQQVKDTVAGTAKTALSILAQVPVNGTGTHFVEGFRTDTYLRPAGSSGAFREFFGDGGVEGAQYALRGDEVPTTNTPTKQRIWDDTPVPFPATSSPDIPSLDLSETQNKYLPQESTPYPSGRVPITYLGLKKNDPTLNQNVTRESRVLLGDQGGRSDSSKVDNQYWFASSPVDIANRVFAKETDKINALDIQDTKVNGETEGRDFIKFRFHIVTPDSTRILYFRALLDSFSDNYTGGWNQVKYLGRAEDMQVYAGFQRKISLSFKIAAATRAEMKPLYRKMLYLASATAPTYGQSGQFMRGTITKLTVGDYVYELPGVLNSVSFDWQTDYQWEIAMKEPESVDANGNRVEGTDGSMQELPMILDCKIDFTPIHTFTPETGLKKYFTTGTENAIQEAGGGVDVLGKGFFIDEKTLGGDPIAVAKAKANSDDSSKGQTTQAQSTTPANAVATATPSTVSPTELKETSISGRPAVNRSAGVAYNLAPTAQVPNIRTT